MGKRRRKKHHGPTAADYFPLPVPPTLAEQLRGWLNSYPSMGRPHRICTLPFFKFHDEYDTLADLQKRLEEAKKQKEVRFFDGPILSPDAQAKRDRRRVKFELRKLKNLPAYKEDDNEQG